MQQAFAKHSRCCVAGPKRRSWTVESRLAHLNIANGAYWATGSLGQGDWPIWSDLADWRLAPIKQDRGTMRLFDAVQRAQRSFVIVRLSAFARSRVDSSLRLRALAIACSDMPFLTSR